MAISNNDRAEPRQQKRSRADKAVDFSHYRTITAGMVAAYIDTGRRPSDEMYLEAAEAIEPPLLPVREMELLRRELTPSRGRRGRPRKGTIRPPALALRLAQISRPDIRSQFIAGLAARLQDRSSRITEADRRMAAAKPIFKQQRDSIMRGLYQEVHALLDGSDRIVHPILGEIEVTPITERHGFGRREQALKIVRLLMNERLGFELCMKIQSMKNIATKKFRRKNVTSPSR